MFTKALSYDIKQNFFEHIGFNIPSIAFVIIKIVLYVLAAYVVYNAS
jgi:hypothetical protein